VYATAVPKEEAPPEMVGYFRRFPARRKRIEHECAECGKRFEGLERARYCSNTCNQRALRREKRQQAGEEQE
jgi:hypothetical protein